MVNELENWRAEQQRIYEKNRNAYLAISYETIAAHNGEYVGIVDGKIIGFDVSEQNLEARIEQQLGANVNMYLRKVGEEDVELKIRSARLDRN